MSIPSRFLCPITDKMMRIPVVDTEGTSYELSAIQKWLKHSKSSPITQSYLTFQKLVLNDKLLLEIDAYKEALFEIKLKKLIDDAILIERMHTRKIVIEAVKNALENERQDA